FASRPEDQPAAEGAAAHHVEDARRLGFIYLAEDIPRPLELDFHLALPGAAVPDPVQRLVWRGRASYVSFPVTVPDRPAGGKCSGKVTVSRAGAPLGHISFMVSVNRGGPPNGSSGGPPAPTPGPPVLPIRLPQNAIRYRRAFAC